MSNSTPNPSVNPRPKYDPEKLRRALNSVDAKFARMDRLPHLRKIIEVACGARMARDSLIELMDMSANQWGVMDPSEDEDDAATWEDLDYEMAAWLWTLNHLIDFLHDNFTEDVEEAWFHAGALKGEEEAAYRARPDAAWLPQTDAAEGKDDAPAPAPHVAELPRAKSRPYWLAQEGQS